MYKHILKIFILLLSATAVLSCSAGPMDMNDISGKERSITITGTASDIDTGRPIQDIRLTMYALENDEDDNKFSTENTSTDNSGKFIIKMTGFKNPTSFMIRAEDPNGIYETGTHEIPLVKWSSSYNVSHGTFYVNGCDFHLKRAE